MAWARLDDNFPDHPKVLPLSDSAFRTHVTAICYSQRVNTHGVVSREALAIVRAKGKAVQELVSAGLWEPHSTGWEIHDFLLYHPYRDNAVPDPLRRARSEAGRIGGLRSGETRRSKPEANEEANEKAKTKQFASKQTKPHPIPTHPIPPDDSLRSSSTPGGGEGFEPEYDVGFRERYGTLTVLAYGGELTAKLADEFKQLADEFSAEQLSEAVGRARNRKRGGKRLYPSDIWAELEEASPDSFLPPRVLQHPAAVGRGDTDAIHAPDFGAPPVGYED